MQKGIFWKLRIAEVEEAVWGLGLHQQKKLLKYSLQENTAIMWRAWDAPVSYDMLPCFLPSPQNA